jgi:ATP-binding cassette subfamily B protein
MMIWITKLVIDAIVRAASAPSPGDFGPLWTLVAILAGFWVLQSATSALNNALTGILRCKVEQRNQTLIMRKCGELDIVFLENSKNLDLLENATRGAMSAWMLIWMLFSLVRSSLSLLTFLAILVRLHWGAAVLLAFTTAPQMVSASFFARRHWAMMTGCAEDSRLRYYITWLTGQGASAKELRVFDLMEAILDRFRYYCRKFLLHESGIEQRREMANFLLGVVASAGAAAIWFYIILRAVSRTINVGDVVLYTQAVSSCQGNLLSLFTQGGHLYEQTLFLGSLFSLLDLQANKLEGALVSPTGKGERWGNLPAPRQLQRGIEFRNVSFHYPGTKDYTLKDLSFTIRPGQSVALVGKNRAGKTTLVKLLVRLYDPTEGEILLEGRPLRDYDLTSLRRCFAVIFQDFVHYALTARENVGFGQVEYVDDLPHVQTAAAKAGAQEIIERLPKKYETYLDKRFGLGEELSGGEWQKIALARAFMRESPIFILDEPTASLDAFAESEVYRTFEELTSGRTSVFISHRFSTVRVAGHILVLDGGRLVDEGTHQELMTRPGLYTQMFNIQAERYR